MKPEASTAFSALAACMAQDHFAAIPAEAMRGLLVSAQGGKELSQGGWETFASSWNNLPSDGYMADGGRYRQRRHAVFEMLATGTVTQKPQEPHYQSRDRNPLNGGIERWFEALEASVLASPELAAAFAFCSSLLRLVRPEIEVWHVETHQFRILALPETLGKPTPEGLHRDGVDFVLVLLIRRENVTSGTTSIVDLQGKEVGEFTLSSPLDAAIVDDRFVFHGVTPIAPKDPEHLAYRDVLVVTVASEERHRLSRADAAQQATPQGSWNLDSAT